MDGYVRIKAELDTKEFDNDLNEMTNNINESARKAGEEAEGIARELGEAILKYKELSKSDIQFSGDIQEAKQLKEQIIQLASQLEKITGEKIHVKGLFDQQQQQNATNIDDKLKGIIKKASKWALSVFGVRSAYMAVRNAMNILSQNDKQLKADIDYIKNILAYVLEPIVKKVVEWAKTLLGYLSYIIKAWTGKDIFGDADKKLKQANKDAKKLGKTLASFDELTIIGDKNDADTDITPSFNLGDVNQIDVPDWVKWIADHKDLIIGLASAVGIAFGASKVSGILSNISKIFGVAGGAGTIGGSGLMGLFTSLATIVAVAGSIVVVLYIGKQVWDDLKKLGDEIEQISKKGKELNENWKKSLDPAKDLKTLSATIGSNITGGEKNLEQSNNWLYKLAGSAKGFLTSAENVAKASDTTLDSLIEMYNYEGRTKEEKQQILQLMQDQARYNDEVIVRLKEEGQKTAEVEKINKRYMEQIKYINNDLAQTEKKTENTALWWENAKGKIDGVLTKVKDLNNQKVADKNFTIEGKTKIDTSDLSKVVEQTVLSASALSGAFIPSVFQNMLTKIKSWKKSIGLAHGGIINNPGVGVPLASNIYGGERGAEAVIPLTDDTLQRLANKIPITIELTNRLDSRIISKEMVDINNDKNFARNGG